MKKVFNLVFAVLATLAVVNCGGTVEVPTPPDDKPVTPYPGPDEPEDEGFGGDVTFTATIESLSDGSQPSWKKGESISVFDGESVVKSTNTAEDGPVGKFPATIKKGTEAVFALYPSVEGIRPSATSVNLEIPAEQTVGTPVPDYKVAKGKSDLLYFRNLLATVKFTIGLDNVTSVAFKAAGDAKVAGAINVDYSGENPVVSASTSTVTLKGQFKKGDACQITLAPAQLSGYTLEVCIGEKVVAHVDGAQTTLASGSILDLSEIKEDNPVYQITHMWLFGGTMPEWNCTAVFDMFTKAEQFNNEDGRGLNALKDNYLVLDSDGTFRNWAGEDGRNWWFVYDGAYNAEGGVDVDLKQFFDVLPRSTATYTIDSENNVVFTLPDGTTRNATLVPAGKYLMPQTTENGKPGQYITITDQALLFQITGGRDNYGEDVNMIYKDYWRICAHPRALFVEIKKVEEGFVLPASACTTDADFEYVPPTYNFDINTLPGVWNVYGGNSEPYGIWVNGGSGSDPAFISPIDKVWCWGPKTADNSVYCESDNTLTIKVTGLTQTSISGTIKWEAGEDGKFWDCIWRRNAGEPTDAHFGEDLSKYFSQLPKNTETAFSVDLSTMELLIGDNLKPRFLMPGVQTFTCGKRLEIPSNCFGLAFHNMDAIPVVEADHYSDVDRFVNAPLDYVIIFEKK